MRPSTSPRRSSKLTSVAVCPRSDRAARQTSPSAVGEYVAGVMPVPTIISTRSASLKPAGSAVPTRRPSRSTDTRSVSTLISSRRWLTNTTPGALARRAANAVEQAVHSVARQIGGGLVQQQHAARGLLEVREGAHRRQQHPLDARQRHHARLGRDVEVEALERGAHRRSFFAPADAPAGVRFEAADAEVLQDAELGNQAKVLMDEAEPEPSARSGGIGSGTSSPLTFNDPSSGVW